jgi:Na+/melibiose symporter-like transporter
MGLFRRRQHSAAKSDITAWQILAFAGITGPLATAGTGTSFITPFYTEIVGFSLASVGLLMTFGRIYDVIMDVVIAYISDNTSSRFGKRKLWVMIGMAFYIPGAWLLYHPPAATTMVEFGFFLFLFFTAWTVAYIPALTQATELSANFQTRGRVSQVQALVSQMAIISAILLPFLFVDGRNIAFRTRLVHAIDGLNLHIFDRLTAFLSLPTAHGGEIFHRNLAILAWGIVLIAPLLLIFYTAVVPPKPAGPAIAKGSVTAALRNPVFQRFALGYFFVMCGYMGRAGLLPFVIMQGLQLPDSFLILFMTLQLSGMVVTPFWGPVLRRFERSTCFTIAVALEIVALAMLMLIPPGNEGLAMVAMIIAGLPGQAIFLVPNLIAGDCADYAKWKTGTESRAVHVSLISIMIKIGAISSALLVWLAAQWGFDPKIKPPSAHAIMILKVTGLLIPMILLAIGAFLSLRFPLTQRRMAAIQARIQRRG